MIVKNEEQFLENCLSSVQDLVDEIVIVDTGSTDKTKEIAKNFGHSHPNIVFKMVDFVWNDDFSAARNESLKYASGDWILVLDADEVLPDESKILIKKKLLCDDCDAYFLPQVTYTNVYIQNPTFVARSATFFGTRFRGYFYGYIIRLFKNRKGIYFDYCVHETVDLSLQQNHKTISTIMVPIIHLQELKGEPSLHKKQKTYFLLLQKNLQLYPNYGKSYNDLGLYFNTYEHNLPKSLEYAQKAVHLEPQNVEFILNLGYRLRDLGQYQEALDLFTSAFHLSNTDERIILALGYILYKLHRYDESSAVYSKILSLNSPKKEHILKVIDFILKEKQSQQNL